MSSSHRYAALTAALMANTSALVLVSPAHSQDAAPAASIQKSAASASNTVAEVVVSGVQFRGKVTPLALSNDAKSDIASVTALSAEDIQRQSLGVNVDVFRSVPGVQVGDFGQVGIAQGITLRGWPGANDSSSVAYYLDGVQRNEPSGTGANGYLDIGSLIPSVLQGLTLVKGPFDTRYGGDFALGGSAIATSVDYLPTSLAVEGGSYGHARILGTVGYRSGDLTAYTAIQGLHEDGYQRNSRNNQLSTFSKLGFDAGPGRLSFSLQTYDIKYGSPGYIDLANLQAGLISPRSDVNDTDGGNKQEYTFVGKYQLGDTDRGMDVTAFVDNEHRQRFASFTPYPQTATEDRRTWYGGSVEPHIKFNLFDRVETEFLAGVSVRHDDINNTIVPSTNGVKITDPDPIDVYGYHRDGIGQTQVAGYANAAFKPFTWLKLTGGFRYDWFDYDVRDQFYVSGNNTFGNQHIRASTGSLSPKGGIAIRPSRWLTLYANIGQSLTSPDAWRDITVNPHLASSALLSKEVGVALNGFNQRFHIQASYYDTVNSNEIIFQGLGAVNLGQTHRSGYDIESSGVALRNDWASVRLYANYSSVSAHLSNGSFVPNVAKWVGSYGVHADITPVQSSANRVALDLGQEWTGPQALDAPQTVTSGTYSRITGRLAYDMPEVHHLSFWTSTIVYTNHPYDEFGFVAAGRAYVTSLPRVRWLVGVSAQF